MNKSLFFFLLSASCATYEDVIVDERPIAGSEQPPTAAAADIPTTRAAASDIGMRLKSPITTPVVSLPFGVTDDGEYHSGVDFKCKPGEPVLSSADGKVYETAKQPRGDFRVRIQHGADTETHYSHLSTVLPKFITKKGRTISVEIRRGQQIGTCGKVAGSKREPHIHLELWGRVNRTTRPLNACQYGACDQEPLANK